MPHVSSATAGAYHSLLPSNQPLRGAGAGTGTTGAGAGSAFVRSMTPTFCVLSWWTSVVTVTGLEMLTGTEFTKMMPGAAAAWDLQGHVASGPTI